MKKYKYIISMLVVILFIYGCTKDSIDELKPADRLNNENKSDIYFATGNDYYDLYVGHSQVPGPEIELLSREYIDPESIQVYADLQAKYTVYVTQQKTGKSLTTYQLTEEDGVRILKTVSVDAYDFPLYLYQDYSGMDWAKLGKAHGAYWSAMEEHKNGTVDAVQVDAAFAAYKNAQTQYAEDYLKLTVKDVPTFYRYLIQVMIIGAEVEETLRSVKVTIGETTYDVDVGQINICPDPGYSHAEPYLMYAAGSPFWISCYPYGEGIEKCQSNTYYAQETVTLTGISFRENSLSTAQVLDVTVVIADDLNSVLSQDGITIPWDGEEPILVQQGKYVGITITFQDERLKETHYHGKLYPILQLEHNGEIYEVTSEIPMMRKYTDSWLLYAIGLDGRDMESYFNDYYYVAVSTWRENVKHEPWGSQE